MHVLRLPEDPSLEPNPALSTAPLAAVVVALISLWALSIPAPLHAVALNLSADCASGDALQLPTHIVRIDADNALQLDGQRLTDQRAVVARLVALTPLESGRRLALRIEPHPDADYRVVMAVLAAAQRHNVVHLQVQADGYLLPRATCPPWID